MAIIMTLLFIMTGLVEQFNTEPYMAANRAGGDMNWVVDQGTGGPFTSPKPVAAERFADVPGEPILVAPSSIDGFQVRLVARSYDALVEPTLVEGRYPSSAGEVMIDESADLPIGQSVSLGGQPATIVGLTEDATVLAGVNIAFVTLDFGQSVAVSGQDLLLAKLTDQTPTVDPSLKILTAEQIGDDALVPLDGAISSVTLIKALLWLITVIVIAAIIYISALERTRDFAVLKAVGGRTSKLGGSLLIQGLVMTLLAVVVAGLLQLAIAPSFPLKVRVPTSAWFTIGGGATLASIAAGAAGVMRVRSTSPAEAFA